MHMEERGIIPPPLMSEQFGRLGAYITSLVS